MRADRFNGVLVAAAGVALVGVHYAVFVRFFPNESGFLGHDYGYFLPHLLDGYFWAHQNGPLATPWFTPAFCGGLPKYPNPQALYYSVPQLATFFVGPIVALRVTLAVFAALGFLGAYLLLRGSFATRRASALLGATLFLWNSLFWSRMAIGHLTFHSFMLVPLLAWLVLGSAAPGRDTWRGRILDVVGAAVILAYMATTAIAHVVVQAVAITLWLALLRTLVSPEPGATRRALARLGGAGAFALCLAASKLTALYAYVDLFPRLLYPLPGVEGVGPLLGLAFRVLFFGSPGADAGGLLVNSRWRLRAHELEYSVGFVPLWVLVMAAAFGLYALRRGGARERWPRERALALLGVVALLLLPIALNYYSPGWNAFLKSLPYIGSGSTQLRWLSLYVPAAVVGAAVALDRTPLLRDYAGLVAVAGIAGAVWLGATTDRRSYHAETFDPAPVVAAHRAVAAGAWSPAIERIGARAEPGAFDRLRTSLTRGESDLDCYETLLGFRLERFPRGALRPGPALEERGGRLNLKDPSCYVFPDENGCAPGDHFAASRRADAEALLAYRPFSFERSGAQRVAALVTAMAAALALLAVGWVAADAARGRADRPGDQ